MGDEARGPVTPSGVNHLVLNVRDIEESHHFWSDLLGFKQVGEIHPDNPALPPLAQLPKGSGQDQRIGLARCRYLQRYCSAHRMSDQHHRPVLLL